MAWTPPAAVTPGLSSDDPLPSLAKAVDVNLFAATLERPLFSPSRRPPPPPKKEEEQKPPEPDPFEGVHLFGLYGGDGSDDSPTGMLARIAGKVRRISVKDSLGSWTLERIEDRAAIFVKNGEERKLDLVFAKPAPPPKAAPAPGAPGAAPAAGAPAPQADGDAEQRRQQQEEARRDRIRRRNEARIKAGAPPIPLD